ncbi:MAG: response regulator [Spirochaetes bacterium]|nr:response regulator [Spirochaetota bacterium]MBU0955416.1 response regulator [Spirochaetota bacterium]
MTILVVDDSRIMRNIIKNTLTGNSRYAHAQYLESPDGREAQRIISSQKIDLLLLDWNMPMLNGLELVKKLRADPLYAKLPIIMITSESAKYSVIEAVKAGVNDYLIKPVSEKLLMEKLERLGF